MVLLDQLPGGRPGFDPAPVASDPVSPALYARLFRGLPPLPADHFGCTRLRSIVSVGASRGIEPPGPPFHRHILHVFFMCPNEHVLGVHARRVVAPVAKLVVRQLPPSEVLEDDTVRAHTLVAKAPCVEDSVALVVPLAAPFPAAGFGDCPSNRPESFIERLIPPRNRPAVIAFVVVVPCAHAAGSRRAVASVDLARLITHGRPRPDRVARRPASCEPTASVRAEAAVAASARWYGCAASGPFTDTDLHA